eukprot:gene25010-31413_t
MNLFKKMNLYFRQQVAAVRLMRVALRSREDITKTQNKNKKEDNPEDSTGFEKRQRLASDGGPPPASSSEQQIEETAAEAIDPSSEEEQIQSSENDASSAAPVAVSVVVPTFSETIVDTESEVTISVEIDATAEEVQTGVMEVPLETVEKVLDLVRAECALDAQNSSEIITPECVEVRALEALADELIAETEEAVQNALDDAVIQVDIGEGIPFTPHVSTAVDNYSAEELLEVLQQDRVEKLISHMSDILERYPPDKDDTAADQEIVSTLRTLTNLLQRAEEVGLLGIAVEDVCGCDGEVTLDDLTRHDNPAIYEAAGHIIDKYLPTEDEQAILKDVLETCEQLECAQDAHDDQAVIAALDAIEDKLNKLGEDSNLLPMVRHNLREQGLVDFVVHENAAIKERAKRLMDKFYEDEGDEEELSGGGGGNEGKTGVKDKGDVAVDEEEDEDVEEINYASTKKQRVDSVTLPPPPPLLKVINDCSQNIEEDLQNDAVEATQTMTEVDLSIEDVDAYVEEIAVNSSTTVEQLIELLHQGSVEMMCDRLMDDDDHVVMTTLDSLFAILLRAEVTGHLDTVLERIQQCGGQAKIEKLQEHENSVVYERAANIQQMFFLTEEVVIVEDGDSDDEDEETETSTDQVNDDSAPVLSNNASGIDDESHTGSSNELHHSERPTVDYETSGSSLDQIAHRVQQGHVQELCEALNTEGDDQAVLDALDNLRDLMDIAATSPVLLARVQEIVTVCKGGVTLEDFCMHDDPEVCNRADALLSAYFREDESEEEDIDDFSSVDDEEEEEASGEENELVESPGAEGDEVEERDEEDAEKENGDDDDIVI